MQYYPLFLDITRIKCLVLGAGKVARRKISTLCKAMAKEILVIDPFVTESDFIKSFEDEFHFNPVKNGVFFCQRDFTQVDLLDVQLAFAATSSSERNSEFVKLCEKQKIFCNVIENPCQGNFIVPAHLDFENLIIALSSSGVSPAFTKVLKNDLKNFVEKSSMPYLRFLKMLRPLVLENVPEKERSDIFRALTEKDFQKKILLSIENNDIAMMRENLEKILPGQLVRKLDERFLIEMNNHNHNCSNEDKSCL